MISVQPYPWKVRIYKGEGRFLIVAEVQQNQVVQVAYHRYQGRSSGQRMVCYPGRRLVALGQE